MGTVYSAVQTALGRRVVVKTLHPHLMEDPDLIARFHREARHAAGLQHPNTVQVYDFGRDGDTHYIAMEFIDGLDLKEILTLLGPFPTEIVTLVLRDICRGMEAAHRRDLVHRDIKPANLMITRTGVVKVMDFGLARETAESSTLTRHGSVMGSAAYMSPEQAQGLSVDNRTDVFSTGLVGYEIASGVRAFPGDNYAAVLRAVVFDDMDPLERHRDGLPAELYDVIRSMTLKDLPARCPSMGAARDQLEGLAQRLGLRGEDRILADWVHQADLRRAAQTGGVDPRSGAAVDATALAGGTSPDRAGADDATRLVGESPDVLGTTPSGSGAVSGSGGPRSTKGPTGGPARGSDAVSPGGYQDAGHLGSGGGPKTDASTRDSGGDGHGADSGGTGGAGTGSTTTGGSGGFRRAALWVVLALVLAAGGFFGWKATRPPVEPIRPSTACCFEDGTCRLLPESQCLEAEGTSEEAEVCSPNPCLRPTGACCFPAGDCQILDEAKCTDEGGEFQGVDVTCGRANCAEPDAVCCLPSGECRIETRSGCGSAGGDFRASETTCEPNPCPQREPTGACCRGEECEVTTRSECQVGGGEYEGDGKGCSPHPCHPAAPTSAVFNITTAPTMMVAIDGGDLEPNLTNSFRRRLTFATHTFRVVNAGLGIDTLLVFTVRDPKPDTILLNMLKCRCVKQVESN